MNVVQPSILQDVDVSLTLIPNHLEPNRKMYHYETTIELKSLFMKSIVTLTQSPWKLLSKGNKLSKFSEVDKKKEKQIAMKLQRYTYFQERHIITSSPFGDCDI